jgi:hemoglobin
MKTANRIIAICALALGLSSNAFAEDKKVSSVEPSSIYHRIGGQAAINAAVDLFYTKVLVDKRVNHFFEDVNMSRQNKRQKAFLGAALGGPVPYEGKTMRKAHAHLDLTEADFNVIAGHLQNTLKELKLDAKLIQEVMTMAASTKNAVLNKPELKKP